MHLLVSRRSLALQDALLSRLCDKINKCSYIIAQSEASTVTKVSANGEGCWRSVASARPRLEVSKASWQRRVLNARHPRFLRKTHQSFGLAEGSCYRLSCPPRGAGRPKRTSIFGVVANRKCNRCSVTARNSSDFEGGHFLH